jgi:hexokinase
MNLQMEKEQGEVLTVKVKQKVQDFMSGYRMDCKSIDLDAVCAAFIDEMTAGLTDQGSSLAMIPTYIRMDSVVPRNEKVIVIDAGGSNLRVALVWFDDQEKPVIEGLSFYKMPGSDQPVSRDVFYRTIAEYLKPLLPHSRKIGFCFSYPTEMQASRDGRVLALTKEVVVHGLEGDMIGENLLKTIREMGFPEERSVVILNDTVACLLSGAFANADRVFDSYIGLIVGTGTNTCYVEKTAAIPKLHIETSDETMLINIESGGYGGAPRGQIDVEVDQRTTNPGDQKFEKMISGHYQGMMFEALMVHGLEDGLFSRRIPAGEVKISKIGAKDLDEFLFYPYDENRVLLRFLADNGIQATEQDRLVLYYLIDELIERTAIFVTANISAVMSKTGSGTNPCRPVCVTADGSTFYKSKMFRDKLAHYVKTYMNEKKGQYCDFVKAENGNLVGTAAAGLQA